VRRLQGPRLHIALQVCVLLLIAGTALTYPISLPDGFLRYLGSKFENKTFSTQVIPWLSSGFTPLILKECLFTSLLAALGFVFVWIKIRGQWLGQERSALAVGQGWKYWLERSELWLIVLVGYAAASVAWSEVFQQSLQSWVLFASGAALILICRSEICGQRFAVRFMTMSVLTGVIIALLALLQHIEVTPFLPQTSDPRNRMSSLIGHNTGMSAWLMFPLSYAIYFLFTNRRMWVKILNGLFIGLFLLVIIAAQSRAIWLLGLLLIVLLPVVLIRLNRLRVKRRFVGIGAAAIILLIALLTISPQSNRLARLPVSLKERVTTDILSLDQLRHETRLRILVVTLFELVPEAPVFGTGFGSFAWEYPKAQGQYFNKYPDSQLGTTTRRTDLAHNDYLQFLAETGLVGLFLLGGCLVTFWRQSLKTYLDLNSSFDRSKWWALTAPSMAVALHGFVDFPFHVVPIAAIALVSISLASRINCKAIPAETSAVPRADFRNATLIALAATTLLFAWLPWGWSALVGRVLVSDIYFNIGQRYLLTNQAASGQTIDRRMTLLDQSRRAFREAVITNVFNGEAYEGQATAYINKASYALHGYQQMQASDVETTTSHLLAIENLIESDTRAAISVLENQVRAGGLRYHYTWYLLGRAWEILRDLHQAKPGDSALEDEAYRNAIEAYETSLQYNPVDSISLFQLSNLLLQAGDMEKSLALRQRLFEKDPWAATDLVLQPAIDLAAAGEIPKAREVLDPIFQEMGNHPRVLEAKAWLAYSEAVWPPQDLDVISREQEYLEWRRKHLATGEPAIAGLPSDDSYYGPLKRRLQMLYAAAVWDYAKANRLATEAYNADGFDREALAIKYWTDHKLHGQPLKLEDSVEYYRTRALLALYFMDNRRSGLSLGELATREPLTLPEARRFTAFCAANGFTDFLQKVLPDIRKYYPADPVFAEQAAIQ